MKLKLLLIGILFVIVSCAVQKTTEQAAVDVVEPEEVADVIPKAKMIEETKEPEAETAPEEPVEEPEAPVEFQSSDFVLEKDEGIIRAVGCNRAKSQVYLTIKNTRDQPWNYYKKEIGQTEFIKLKHNSRVKVEGVDLECGSSVLEAGEEAHCVLSDVLFRSGNGINGGDIKDRIVVIAPGPVRDVVLYVCPK